MNTVPIVFCIDGRIVLPASVAIYSLLKNAKENTFYDIFILHSGKEYINKTAIESVGNLFEHCRISYREVDGTFDKAFEVRDISTAAYYRLLIPNLVPEYDKVIYADADIIFRMDLSEVYSQDFKDNYIAAVKDPGINLTDDGLNHIKTLAGVQSGRYINSGFLVMNTSLMRKDKIVDTLKITALRKWRFQDQDTLNIVCSGRIVEIAPKYNMMDYSYLFGLKHPDKWQTLYPVSAFQDGVRNGNIHYNGHKPWKKWCVNFDIWWQYFRLSPVYDENYCFDFYYSHLNELDSLPLLKRIKILARYFIFPPK